MLLLNVGRLKMMLQSFYVLGKTPDLPGKVLYLCTEDQEHLLILHRKIIAILFSFTWHNRLHSTGGPFFHSLNDHCPSTMHFFGITTFFRQLHRSTYIFAYRLQLFHCLLMDLQLIIEPMLIARITCPYCKPRSTGDCGFREWISDDLWRWWWWWW